MTSRALVAVLMTDMVGSTATRQQLGEGHDRELQRLHQQILTDEATHAGAEITKWEGDGILAVFRSPTAAIEAATRIQQRVAEHNAHPLRLAPLSVRAGIAVGEAELRPGDLSGDPPIEASRLCALAAGGQILCSELVRALTPAGSGVTFREAGEAQLKGYDHAIRLVEVDWRSLGGVVQLHDFPERLVDVSSFGFAGRSVELQELRSAWSEASHGRMTLVLVAGEAGVGKSRLAAEAAREAHAVGAEVLYGRCDPVRSEPYQPFAEALADHVRRHHVITGDDDVDAELARLLPNQGRPTAVDGAASGDATLVRFYGAVAAWLEHVAGERPVLFIIDDLAWADAASLELLLHLVERAPTLPVLVVATYRDSLTDRTAEFVNALGRLRRSTRVRQIPLTGLDGVEIGELLRRFGDQPLTDVHPGFIDRLLELTGGNAFFMTELISWLRRQGTLDDAARGGWVNTGHGVPVPSGVADVVAQRLLALPDAARAHLRSAAVIGSEFELAVLDRLTGDVPVDDLLGEMEAAIALGILREVPGRTSSFRFTHDLVREALLGDLSAARVALLHGRIGDAIEAIHAGNLQPHAAELGRHLALASDPAVRLRAVDHLAVAAQSALDTAAPELAVRHLRRALELATADGGTAEAIAQLTYRLGVALRRSGSIEAKGVLLRAGHLAEQLGNDDLFIQAALSNSRGMFSMAGRVDGQRVQSLERALELLERHGDGGGHDRTAERAAVLASLSEELTYHPDRARTAELSSRAEALARQSGDRSTLIRALMARHSVLWHPAGFRERVAITDELEQLTRGGGDPGEATAMSLGFQAAIEGARPDAARRRLQRLRELAERLHQPAIWAYTHLWDGVLATLAGDLAAGERAAATAFELNLQIGSPDAGAWVLGQLYPIRWHQGRLGELEASFVDGLTQFPNLPVLAAALANIRAESHDVEGARQALAQVPLQDLEDERAQLDQLVAVACLVRTARHLDDRDLAARMLPLLEPYADQHITNGSCHFGSVHHYVGLAEATLGRVAAASARFELAVRANEQLGAPPLVARTLVCWADALLDRGGPEDRAAAGHNLELARHIADQLSLAGVARDVTVVAARAAT